MRRLLSVGALVLLLVLSSSTPSQVGRTGGPRGLTGTAGLGYGATSSSSLAIATGSKSFTTQANLAYTAGARVRASSAANTANYMEGVVASYSGQTLVLTVDTIGGTGTKTDWNINLAGNVGAAGVATVQFCGTTTSCSHTNEGAAQIVYGSAALVSGSPSTAAVTGISPAFTSASSYLCAVTARSGTPALSVANVSGSAFTITGPNTSTLVINYICVGI